MPEMKEIVWIAMDGDGDCAVSLDDENSAVESYADNYGARMTRVVKIKVRPPVAAEAETVTVPDEAGQEVEAAA